MQREAALPDAPSSAPPLVPTASPLAVLRMWGLHSLSLALPLYVLTFLLTGPHPWYASLPWLAMVALLFQIDKRSGPAVHKPVEGAPSWPFDLILLALSGLQLATVLLAARLVAQAGLFSADALVTIVLVGLGSGVSAIIVAHELIHRKERWMVQLGRLLLCTVFYEHFSVEHVRGHHARLGTEDDPATSRFGETYGQFWKRTVPGQLRSAFRLEQKRLGDEQRPLFDARTLGNSVVHGVLAQVALAIFLFALFGPAGLVAHLGQAYVAVRLLEAVNYFEHYGLIRKSRKVRPVDSWDSDSWFTLFALVGLSRHADHHAYASRPFQALRTWDESPKLPHGYVVTTLMVIFANAKIRALLDAELARKKLGPFAET
jgi:alkane 1-monooxygenase